MPSASEVPTLPPYHPFKRMTQSDTTAFFRNLKKRRLPEFSLDSFKDMRETLRRDKRSSQHHILSAELESKTIKHHIYIRDPIEIMKEVICDDTVQESMQFYPVKKFKQTEEVPCRNMEQALSSVDRKPCIPCICGWQMFLFEKGVVTVKEGANSFDVNPKCKVGHSFNKLIFPRIFMLQADMAELYTLLLLLGIGSEFRCPICLAPKAELHNLSHQFLNAVRNSLKAEMLGQSPKRGLTNLESFTCMEIQDAMKAHNLSTVLLEQEAVPALRDLVAFEVIVKMHVQDEDRFLVLRQEKLTAIERALKMAQRAFEMMQLQAIGRRIEAAKLPQGSSCENERAIPHKSQGPTESSGPCSGPPSFPAPTSRSFSSNTGNEFQIIVFRKYTWIGIHLKSQLAKSGISLLSNASVLSAPKPSPFSGNSSEPPNDSHSTHTPQREY
ncbi:hypothetical protein BT69DRAFT_1295240 [Atractiella rhizophila]|nr:hypothetical protein BT69DRAFT_1295240 [Atractiella rhizophila]